MSRSSVEGIARAIAYTIHTRKRRKTYQIDIDLKTVHKTMQRHFKQCTDTRDRDYTKERVLVKSYTQIIEK